MPCRINRRRLWTARLVLESYMHEFNSFATLTYKPRYHFYCKVEPRTLIPEHMQSFLKRLRKMYSPQLLRFYGVGEYGDQNNRPHYHLALFGVGLAERELVEQAWGWGHVHLGELNETSAHYIAGYLTKKMTAPDDPRLEGRHPEFARMSLRPGIGKKAAEHIANQMTTYQGALGVAQQEDISTEVRINGKKFPLGRYLQRAVREAAGYGPDFPTHKIFERKWLDALMPDQERWALEKRRAASNRTAVARDNIKRSKRTL